MSEDVAMLPRMISNRILNEWLDIYDLYNAEMQRFTKDYPQLAHDYLHMGNDVLTAITEDFYSLCLI